MTDGRESSYRSALLDRIQSALLALSDSATCETRSQLRIRSRRSYDAKDYFIDASTFQVVMTQDTLSKLTGDTMAETDGSGSTSNASYNEYVFFAGQRMAQSNPSSGNVYYYFADQLGSTRVITNASGTPCYEADFLPYGTENTPASFTNTCSTNYKFTGYERDAETAGGTSSGNDYAFARYYNNRMGRFQSGDPMGGSVEDPQTQNRYSYVRNNPVNLTDPSGLCDDEDDDDCGFGFGFGFDFFDESAPTPAISLPVWKPTTTEIWGETDEVQIPLPNPLPFVIPSDPGCTFGGCGGGVIDYWTAKVGLQLT